jgi:DNA repair protein RadC
MSKLALHRREVFAVILLDVVGRMIEYRELFIGGLTLCAVYPREIATVALLNNAASIILAHNHPGGVVEPSPADISLTRSVMDAMAIFDVKVLDHIIVSGTDTLSFQERGMMPYAGNSAPGYTIN